MERETLHPKSQHSACSTSRSPPTSEPPAEPPPETAGTRPASSTPARHPPPPTAAPAWWGRGSRCPREKRKEEKLERRSGLPLLKGDQGRPHRPQEERRPQAGVGAGRGRSRCLSPGEGGPAGPGARCRHGPASPPRPTPGPGRPPRTPVLPDSRARPHPRPGLRAPVEPERLCGASPAAAIASTRALRGP